MEPVVLVPLEDSEGNPLSDQEVIDRYLSGQHQSIGQYDNIDHLKGSGYYVDEKPQLSSNRISKDTYQSTLSPEEENKFREWLKTPDVQNRLPEYNPDNTKEDYDLRGWWLENKDKGVPSGHFTDKYKTPYHKTFSNESIYATEDAPHWEQSDTGYWVLLDKKGKVLTVEPPENGDDNSK